jgi:hypothetical protein
MPVKKRPATKRKRSNKEAADDNTTTTTTTRSAKGQGQPKKQSSSLPSSVIYGSLVLVVGIAVGLILNLTSPVDSSVKAFLSKACRTASCGAFVVPIRRTLQAIKPLRKGDKLMEIPRRMQIWDLDALQDPFVRLLFAARHERTENKLPSGAFLAAWLAMQKVNTTVTDPLLKSYLELLPSEKDVTSHPVFWESNDLNDLLGGHSYTMNIARMYQDMVHSEYFVSVRKRWNRIHLFRVAILYFSLYGSFVLFLGIGQSESRFWHSNYSCRLQDGSNPCLVS